MFAPYDCEGGIPFSVPTTVISGSEVLGERTVRQLPTYVPAIARPSLLLLGSRTTPVSGPRNSTRSTGSETGRRQPPRRGPKADVAMVATSSRLKTSTAHRQCAHRQPPGSIESDQKPEPMLTCQITGVAPARSNVPLMRRVVRSPRPSCKRNGLRAWHRLERASRVGPSALALANRQRYPLLRQAPDHVAPSVMALLPII